MNSKMHSRYKVYFLGPLALLTGQLKILKI